MMYPMPQASPYDSSVPPYSLSPPPLPLPPPPSPLLPISLAGSNSERSEAVAVGTWSMDAAIYSLPDLRPLFKEALPTDVIPRRWAMRGVQAAVLVWRVAAGLPLIVWRGPLPTGGCTLNDCCVYPLPPVQCAVCPVRWRHLPVVWPGRRPAGQLQVCWQAIGNTMRYLCCAASAPQHPGRHRVANQLLRQQPVGES